MGFSGIGAGAAYIFFAYIGFDAVSTTAQEAKNPQRDLPIGIIVSLLACTVLYVAVAGVLTGMVHWQDINIEAPVARAFLDRGVFTASHIITIGALTGLTSVMLVMLLGQTRVLYSMANDGLLPRKFFADVHPKFRTPFKNTILVGILAAIVGSVTPIEDIGKMLGAKGARAILLDGDNPHAGEGQTHTRFLSMSCLAMIMRCISFVPSPMTRSGASRYRRSILNSLE